MIPSLAEIRDTVSSSVLDKWVVEGVILAFLTGRLFLYFQETIGICEREVLS